MPLIILFRWIIIIFRACPVKSPIIHTVILLPLHTRYCFPHLLLLLPTSAKALLYMPIAATIWEPSNRHLRAFSFPLLIIFFDSTTLCAWAFYLSCVLLSGCMNGNGKIILTHGSRAVLLIQYIGHRVTTFSAIGFGHRRGYYFHFRIERKLMLSVFNFHCLAS